LFYINEHVSGLVGNSFMSGLFLAFVPDAPTAAHICRLAEVIKQAREFDGRLIAPDRLHITLFFLDDGRDPDERTIRMACEAAQAVHMSSFEISFDRTASFRGKPDRHPFVLLGNDGLNRLKLFRQTLGAEMTRKGLRYLVTTDFTPHVTLLYDKRQVEEQPVEPVFWRADEFVLIHSKNGHAHLARWPLRVE
jgi:RNA 2',3'-cyclic 3'-phosphodiesterase